MSGRKSRRILVISALMVCELFCLASANAEPNDIENGSGLQLYLPREVAIKGDTISLGEVSIILGDPNEGDLKAKAGKIALGRISVASQEIVIDRSMILSRLACNGVPVSKVTLTGAEKIRVRRQQEIIKSSEFIELASAFLKKNPPAASVCQWNPIRIPKDLVLPVKREDIKLSPSYVRSTSKNQAKVGIAVVQNGKKIGECEVSFRLKYKCRRAVTLAAIPAGAVINSENVKIDIIVSSQPEPAGWKPPYGLVTRRALAADTVLGSHMFGPVKPEVVVGRNENVVIRIESPLLLVTAAGKAMQEGHVGEYIKVRNLNSQRIILAKVREDGTVEPVF